MSSVASTGAEKLKRPLNLRVKQLRTMPSLRGLALGTVLLAVTACGERDATLGGQRDALRAEAADATGFQNTSQAINLAAAQTNGGWTHRGGGPRHTIAHPALSTSPSAAWTARIGAGDTRRTRITASPVVAEGRIFTLDSQSQVSAVSASGGGVLWQTLVAPETDKASDGSGGALAFGASSLFVTTGFGELRALDPETGATRWVQKLEAPAGAPTVFDGLVYAAARDGTAWAIDAETGRVRWQLSAAGSQSNLVGGPGVAVDERLAIFPFATGELLATFRRGGVRLWDSSVSGGREGRAYARLSDISGDPVISGGRVFVGNQSGRMAALDLDDGSRLWTAPDGAMGPMVAAGGAVFAVTDINQLVRLDAATGAQVWAIDLPLSLSDRALRRGAAFAHYGPVLAGGRIYVASTDGLLRAFSPESGALLASLAINGGAGAAPVVANNTLYVVSRRGQLHAFR